jgi:integrase/recombinase XerD
MAKRKKSLPGNSIDPQGFSELTSRFIRWMEVQNWSKVSIKTRRYYLNRFVEWCEERSIERPSEVTPEILERYKRHVHIYRKKDGKSLTIHSQRVVLTPAKTFFQWLFKNKLLLFNPAADMELPKRGKHLPKNVLTESETEVVLAQPDVSELMGLRNRAILETLYSTGMRRAELCNLQLYDIDAGRGLVMIRRGKGDKDRFVPIGERALKWIAKYVSDVRPIHIKNQSDGPLFVSYRGGPLKPDSVSKITKHYIGEANLGKQGSCHTFRHTSTTLMLEGGADVRYVQEMLGHAELSSTQIYTKVSIRKLKEVYEKTHPAGKGKASFWDASERKTKSGEG